MKEKKKQSVAVVVATVLTVTSFISPIASVYTTETDTTLTQQSETTQIKNTAPTVEVPKGITGEQGNSLADIDLPKGWSWVDKTMPLTQEIIEYPAYFSVDDETYDYSGVEGYNADEHYVECNVPISITIPVEEKTTQINTLNANNENRILLTQNNTNDKIVKIDSTTFPDDMFKKWIIQNIAGAKDGELTTEEIKVIETIIINTGDNITNLKGIEEFTALTKLECRGEGITELDVSKNKALTELNCFNTRIKSLDVSQNSKLVNLNCSSNKNLTNLNVSGTTALTKLTCSGNKNLTNLNISGTTALTELDCRITGIKELDVSNNKKLTYLN